MFKTITAVITAGVMGASPAFAGNRISDHAELWNTIKEAGISTHINPEMCDDETDGFYSSTYKVFVVCQDNGVPGGDVVEWTDNDLDTIRHEAHHVVQDCIDGTLGDGLLSPFFGPEELKEFVKNSTLSDRKVNWIIKSYSDKTEMEVIKEIEAFAVAKDVSASTISSVVKKFCF